jgi:hypothetical protein
MARYVSDKKIWLSHECRVVEAGVEFDTEFPKGPGGKQMVLGETLSLIHISEPTRPCH